MKKIRFIVFISICLFLICSILPTSDKSFKNDNSNIPQIQLSAVTLAQASEQTDKKQSTTKESIKNNSSKKKSTKEKICSSITNILTNEISGTKNKTKKGILQSSLKYANKVCGEGGTPDLNKITEGLPEEDKFRISQKTNAALFDGVDPNLTDKTDVKVNRTLPTLTGKDGKITDLKSYDPTLKTVAAFANAVPPLSLSKADSNPAVEPCKPTVTCPVYQGDIDALNTLIQNEKTAIKKYTGERDRVTEYCLTRQKFCAEHDI
jgi:hypothetical protein